MNPEFAKVAVNLSTNKSIKAFTYRIPTNSQVNLGALVVVPFRSSVIAGYVVGFDTSPAVKEIKSIVSVVDELSLSKKNQELAKWIANHYICSEWSATRLFLPPGNSLKIKEKKSEENGDTKTTYSLNVRKVRKIANPELFFQEVYKEPQNLTVGQAEAVFSINKAIDSNKYKTFLLNGITGSGKTEVYAQAIETALQQDKGAIILVPEIALSVQMVARLNSRFPNKVAILHSGLTQAERLSQWKLIKDGQIPIAIGARSAIFAPIKNLGLVIVDEEHESAYKQNRTPRYNTRDVAIKLAELSASVCILGSATPSLESRYKAEKGEYKQLMLPTKAVGSKVKIELVDMRRLDEKALISSILLREIKTTLTLDNKVLLLLNRRGFSAFLLCPSCGYVAQCERCSVSLTYHKTDQSLKCHHCDYKTKAPSACPKCSSNLFRFAGSGTQKLEQKIQELFPGEVIIRLDRDTGGNKETGQALNKFKQAKRGILLGTQVIGKGLDFKDITLVGIINADTSLNFPDFRAGERTFQLLHQVAGRCGRGEKEGKVIIQTYNSEHYAVKAVVDDNYEEFFKDEINFRKELNYPPCSRLINIGFSSISAEKAKEASVQMANILNESIDEINEIEVLGPVEAPIRFLKNRHRWHLLIKINKAIPEKLRATMSSFSFKDVTIAIDVDPLSLL